MGSRGMTWLLTGVLLLGACDDEEEAVEQEESAIQAEPTEAERAPAEVEREPEPPTPRMGGVVVAAGDHRVEVLPHVSGDIEAMVRTEQGDPIEKPEEATLTIEVPGAEEDETHEIPLKWFAQRSVFLGSVSGDSEISSGPIAVTLDLDGKQSRGKAERVALAPLPRHGGTIFLAGSLVAELRPQSDGTMYAHLYDAAGEPMDGPEVTSVVVRAGEGALDLDLERKRAQAAAGEAEAEAPSAEEAEKGGETPKEEPGGAEVQGDTAAEPGRARLTWNAEASRFEGRIEGDVGGNTRPLTMAVFQEAETHTGRRDRVAFATEPQHEGRVLVAGPYTIEVVPLKGRGVHAYPHAPDGSKITGETELRLHLVLGAHGRGKANARAKARGKTGPAELRWNAEAGRFEGEVPGRGTLKGKPVAVVLASAEGQYVAGVQALDVAPQARPAGEAPGTARRGAGAGDKAGTGGSTDTQKKNMGASGSGRGNIRIRGGANLHLNK